MKTTNWSISRSAVRNRAIVLDAPWSGVNIGRSAMMSVISVEQRGPVTFLAINQPEELNAINNQVAVDLQSALPTSTTRTQRVAIPTGARRQGVFGECRCNRHAGAVALRADGRHRDRKAGHRVTARTPP
jgi:enoyl-CoA hydratase/carnithine racemase